MGWLHCSYDLLIMETLEEYGDCTTREKMLVFDDETVEYEVWMEG